MNTATQATPITGDYEKGPLSIKWTVSGEDYVNCHVEVRFNTMLVAANTLSPGKTNWNTGKHVTSDGWCNASFQLQVPTADQEGQLIAVELIWDQNNQGEQNVSGILLAQWSQTGN
jgi:hypothetical protein